MDWRMGGLDPRNPFVERIVKPVPKIGQPLRTYIPLRKKRCQFSETLHAKSPYYKLLSHTWENIGHHPYMVTRTQSAFSIPDIRVICF